MDIGWLEDYLALRDTGSFTAAAQRRNASQPAFSRRIQALENWLGVTLIDRSRRPPSFTPLALENDAEIRSLLNHFQDLRGRLRGEQKRSSRVRLAMQHSLAVSVFPDLVQRRNQRGAHPPFWLHCADRASCVELMLRGEADLLICYETPKLPASIPATLAERRLVGRDVMVLAGATEADIVRQDGYAEGRWLPLLTYPQTNFFGEIIWDQAMPALASAFDIEVIGLSGFSGVLKQMMKTGMGLAWLPKTLIEEELAAGSVTIFEEERFSCSLDVVLYTRTSGVSAAQLASWRMLFADQPSMHLLHALDDAPRVFPAPERTPALHPE